MKEELTIRVAKPEDAKGLLEIYAPYVEKTAITFEYGVPSELLGYVYAGTFNERSAYDWAVETTIYIREDQKKRGLGKKMYTALEQVLKKQNITNLNACIGVPEVPDEHLDRNSMDFHHHLGYRLVGEFYQCGYKFDTWYNMVWMEKIIGEHQKKQPAMITFPELLKKDPTPWEA